MIDIDENNVIGSDVLTLSQLGDSLLFCYLSFRKAIYIYNSIR
jgi:hypothetical protein